MTFKICTLAKNRADVLFPDNSMRNQSYLSELVESFSQIQRELILLLKKVTERISFKDFKQIVIALYNTSILKL